MEKYKLTFKFWMIKYWERGNYFEENYGFVFSNNYDSFIGCLWEKFSWHKQPVKF